MRRLNIAQKTVLHSFLVFAVGAFFMTESLFAQGGSLNAAPDAETQRIKAEVEYAQALIRMGMPDFGTMVLDKLPKTPKVEVIKKRLLMQVHIARGEFDKVKQMIVKAGSPDSPTTWGMKLTLGEGYFAWGKYNEAEAIFNAYFEKYSSGPAEGMKDFYVEAAYKFAQMMLIMRDNVKALKAYEHLSKVKLERHIERQIMAETAELKLKVAEATTDSAEKAQLLTEVKELCDKILWVQDVWFGKAIAYMAHIEMMNGNPDGATKLLKEYDSHLRNIDESLKRAKEETGQDMTSLSPFAQVRYLIAVMLQESAEKALEKGDKKKAAELLLGKVIAPATAKRKARRSKGALQHFINVFIKYPNTSWAPDAGARAEEVKTIALEQLGVKELKIPITDEQWEKVRKVQFQEARTLYNRGIFEEAATAYVKVLNLFPEGDTSIKGINELARSYIETQDLLSAEMTIRYLAECFSKKQESQDLAGEKVLGLARKFEELKMLDERDSTYDLFFKHFTYHPKAAGMLYSFGDDKYKEKDFEGALVYYMNIIKNHKTSSVFKFALLKASLCYGEMGKTSSEIKMLKALVKYLDSKDVPDVLTLNAKFGIAEAYRKTGLKLVQNKASAKHEQKGNKYIIAAISEYTKLVKMLSPEKNDYTGSEELKTAAAAVLEGSLFYKSLSYQMLSQPEAKVMKYKDAAIKGYKSLVTKFPKSKFAPQALSQAATLYTIFEKAKEAEEMLRQLQRDYPQSDPAKNADFLIAMNLLKMGRTKEAERAFQKMFKSGGKYSAQKILIAGQNLVEFGAYDISVQAFDQALSMSSERRIQEPAKLGKGKALTELKKYKEAMDILDKLMTDYPKSGYTKDTGFYLARAAAEVAADEPNAEKRFDIFNKAMKAINRVKKYAVHLKDKRLKSMCSLETGKILELKAEAEKKHGDSDKAEKYTNDAIGNYQVMIMFLSPRDAAVKPALEGAYLRCLPLLQAGERWEELVEDADKFLKLYPGSRKASSVRVMQGRAKIKLKTAGGPKKDDEEGEEGDDTEPAKPEKPAETAKATEAAPADKAKDSEEK